MHRAVLWAVAVVTLVITALLTWIDVGRARQYQRLLADGDRALARNQFVIAVEAFSGALTLRPDSMLAHLRRGDTYRRQGQYDTARRDLERAAQLDSTAPQPLALLGDVAVAQGRYHDAQMLYRRELALDDQDAAVWYKLGLALYESGQSDGAAEAARRALAIDDTLVEAHHLLGLTCLADNRPQDALGSLRRAVSLDPSFAPARESLVDALQTQGRYGESVDQLEALAALDARPERWVALGRAHARAGRPDAAVVALERAAARAPDDAAARVALARVWLDMAEPGPDVLALRRASDLLRPLVERGDGSSEALTLAGLAALLGGQTALAEQLLQRATTRFPVDPLAYRHLATAARRAGHPDAAREAERRFARLAAR